jgi:hypothetical protein
MKSTGFKHLKIFFAKQMPPEFKRSEHVISLNAYLSQLEIYFAKLTTMNGKIEKP